METNDCCHLHIHEDRKESTEEAPIRECLHRKNAWEKLIPAKACPDDGTCIYADYGGPFEEGEGCLNC